jgi:myosin-5
MRQVLGASATHYTLRLKDGAQQSAERGKVQVFYRNPPEVEAADDLLSLPNLDEANILHSLRVRYWKGHVYSYSGKILLAVNPWRKMDIYDAAHLQRFVAGKTLGSEPHIFATAAEAYRTMLSSAKSQCVLISGESGAGKTESTKYVLQVLTKAGGKSGSDAAKQGGSVAEQIMLGNPVLESFGNAKTLRNDNSSRFGKWIEVVFEGSKIVGAGVKTYLLEKSRVVGQIDGERNFHIFYDLCAAAAAGESSVQGLGLGDAAEFANTKACTRAGARDDAAAFREIRTAMDQMGVGSEAQRSIFSCVTAILHLCSIEVGEENDWDGNSCATVDVKGTSIQHAAKLLQVSAGELKEGLCTRIISTGRDQMRKPENRACALLCLQALCKQLYSKIFERVVELVNAAMKVGGQKHGAGGGGAAGGGQKHVAVLDIFGFESFAENRFEQLCINHANEKLQGHFNNYSFLQERALMEAEGLEVQTSDFVDNRDCIQMLEQAGGLQATLDDVCKMPKGDDKVLLDRLSSDKTLTAAGYLVIPKKKDGTFIIKHYAGSVAYTAEGFCERNKDILPASAVVLLQASKDKLLSTLFEQVAAESSAGAASSRGRGSVGAAAAKKSVSATFKADLNGLMGIINESGPHFVRCINPNRHKQAQVFEDVKAVEQLRCGGVIEAMRMARASFPCRYSHDEFARTYVPFLCPEVATALPVRSKCVACFKALEAAPGHFAVGKTLVLMRREVLDLLERRRGTILFKHAVAIQSAARVLAARTILIRRRKERQELHALLQSKSLCVQKLQAYSRRRKVRQQYIRMVGVARAAATAEAQARKEAARKAKEAKEIEQAKEQELALLKEKEQTKAKQLALDRVELQVKHEPDAVAGADQTESETEGDTEGSMTARTVGSVSSSDTQPPSVASDDESGMMRRLEAMGIGQEAVGHVMWVADSAGGLTSASNRLSANNRMSAQLNLAHSKDPNDPPVIDGLVPLRAGRVHWAGFVSRHLSAPSQPLHSSHYPLCLFKS